MYAYACLILMNILFVLNYGIHLPYLPPYNWRKAF